MTTLAKRFRAKIEWHDGCWFWTGYKMRNGYGTIGVGGRHGRKEFAHRVSWMLKNGPIPTGMYVCHRCDNPPCVNPEHLFLGTPKENQDDMRKKGRHWYPGAPGSRNTKAKLTDEAVRQIHALGGAGYTQQQVAERFGVTQPTIGSIWLGHTWRHLGLPSLRQFVRRDTPAARL